MSRAPKDLKANPLGATANQHGIIDFIDSVHMQTPLENVVGGPPAYLESHGIRYVPDPGPAALGAEGELSPYDDGPGHLSGAPPADAGPYYTQHELDARVDSRITQFLRQNARAPAPLHARSGSYADPHAGPDPHPRHADPHARHADPHARHADPPPRAGPVTRSVTAGQSTDARLRELYARVEAATKGPPIRAAARDEFAPAPAPGRGAGLQAALRASRRDPMYDF